MVNNLILGDCVEVMKEIDRNSIDCVVTDPPYGISFMGKNWDKVLPRQEAFKQMHRILKPGGIAFVMSSPRQDVLWRMLRLLENAGFCLKQSFISWIMKTGFPKAYDVSKGIDKKFNKKRKVIGHYKIPIDATSGHAGKSFSDKPIDGNVYCDPHRDTRKAEITEPATKLSKQWEGWKSIAGLKPALECILMVNKPLSEPTIVDNVLKHGTGAINVDGCRIPFKSKEDKESVITVQGQSEKQQEGEMYSGKDQRLLRKFKPSIGRFPANLLVSDKAIDSGKITKARKGFRKSTKTQDHTIQFEHKVNEIRSDFGDIGDQSRYFSLDAWWDRQCIILDVPKPSKSERDRGLENIEGKKKYYGDNRPNSLECFGSDKREGHEDFGKQLRKNIHPTVKPIKLMAYLIQLGCSPDGIVLDPFVGSGTTCIAAKMLNRKWIGIEVNREYINIASARLDNCPIVEFKPLTKISKVIKEKSEDWKDLFESG